MNATTGIKVGDTVKSNYTIWTGPVSKVTVKDGREYITFHGQDGKNHKYESFTVTKV
jgi:hypothetical protein